MGSTQTTWPKGVSALDFFLPATEFDRSRVLATAVVRVPGARARWGEWTNVFYASVQERENRESVIALVVVFAGDTVPY